MALPASETTDLSEMTDLPDWLKVDVLRVTVTIDHITPFERKFTKTILYQNSGDIDIVDILIPSPEFFNGLKILDDDGSKLTFYTTREIEHIISSYRRDIREGIQNQIQSAYFLWVRLPNNKSLKLGEIKSVRLEYYDMRDNSSERWSIFDTPKFDETVSKLNNIDTYYFIKAPKDFVVEVDETKSIAYTDGIFQENGVAEKIDIKYLKDTSQDDFKDSCIDIKNTSSYVTARIPNREKPFSFRLYYSIKLVPMERKIWQAVLPVVGAMLFGVLSILYPTQIPLNLSSTSLAAIGASVMSVSGALIALVSNPLIHRTRLFLFGHIVLGAIIIVLSGSCITQNC